MADTGWEAILDTGCSIGEGKTADLSADSSTGALAKAEARRGPRAGVGRPQVTDAILDRGHAKAGTNFDHLCGLTCSPRDSSSSSMGGRLTGMRSARYPAAAAESWNV